MKYARKKIMRKKPVFKRKARRPRSIVVRSNPNTDDATVVKLNPGKARIQKWVKMYPPNVPSISSTAGTNGFTINVGATAYAQGGSMTFDPTGNYGNVSGPVTSVLGFSTLSSAALPEWTSFSNLYAQYKVNKITLKFQYTQTNSNNFANPVLFLRYNDEYNPGAPTPTSISEEKNWIKKTFTHEHPNFQYSFYPKVWGLLDNLGAISTDARQTRSMPFTNTNSPVEIAGMKFYIQTQSTSTASVGLIACDIQYDISFKEQT